MRFDPAFSERVSAFGRRVAILREELKGQGSEAGMASELSTALDELRTAEEELHAQQDALMEAQSQLDEERARYGELFEQAPNAYLITDDHGVIKQANEAAGRMLGVQARFLTGKPLLLYFQGGEAGKIKTLMHEIGPETVREFTGRLAPRSGPLIHVQGLVTAVAASDRGGMERAGLRWILVDAEARIRAELEAGECRAELARVKEAYQASLPENVREAVKIAERERARREQAEQASQMKDQFLALVVHELRNPLTPVLAVLEELLEQKNPKPETTRGTLEMMHRNLVSQSRMIGDLLDIARIIHGKLEMHHEPVRIIAPLNEALEGLASAIAGKRQKLRTELPPVDPVTCGDSVRLRQIFWNLISNAIKFTPVGGEIVVRLTAVKDNAYVEVRDTGIGMKPEELPRIFDVFEQTPSLYARSLGGLGLGLSIVRSLVEAHGGHVEAFSRGEGLGSTFRVRLPRVNEQPSPPVARITPGKKTPKLSILVVEDHADTREALASVLMRMGHEVKTAGTVEAAVTEVQQHHFDVMISDLSLPDGNGREILRRAPRDHVALAVACSGWGMPEDFERSRKAGFSLHLTKPVSIDQLRSVLSRFSNDQ